MRGPSHQRADFAVRQITMDEDNPLRPSGFLELSHPCFTSGLGSDNVGALRAADNAA